MVKFEPDLLFVESGGDKIPRKGGPGITQSDLLVINKTDLAALVGADLDVMARDARRMRGSGPCVFAQVVTAQASRKLQGSCSEAGMRRPVEPRRLGYPPSNQTTTAQT